MNRVGNVLALPTDSEGEHLFGLVRVATSLASVNLIVDHFGVATVLTSGPRKEDGVGITVYGLRDFISKVQTEDHRSTPRLAVSTAEIVLTLLSRTVDDGQEVANPTTEERSIDLTIYLPDKAEIVLNLTNLDNPKQGDIS